MALVFHRGDIVVCNLQGDFGKPRPAVVLQSDLFNPTHDSIVVCAITTHLIDASLFRLRIDPSKQNGLKQTSQIMIDKIMTLKRTKIKDQIGKLAPSELDAVGRALERWLGL